MTTIVVSGLLSATNADILADSRLQTVPRPGRMVFELQAADASAANNFVFTLGLPGGEVPCQGVLVPGNAEVAGQPGVLKSDTALVLVFQVTQGGHCSFSCVETGDTEMIYRVTFVG